MPVTLNASHLPLSVRGLVSVSSYGTPRFWATIWSDVLKSGLEASTRRKHLSALDRLYDSFHRQRGKDCLDQLIADADADIIEHGLVGFAAPHIEDFNCSERLNESFIFRSSCHKLRLPFPSPSPFHARNPADILT